ncbi:MAG: riboflavin biosynthesis protein RibD, partial [Candidatus Nanopelagicales bacterium]
MAEAIDLAQHPGAPRGENPRVGCVIVDADGDVVGRGWHGGAGTDHAEVVALGDAGTRARGGTAVVSLEPCRHTGRTPPCTG